MANYVLDQAFRVAEEDGVAAHRVVALDPEDAGRCLYPATAQCRPVLGVTTHAQTRTGKPVAVRRLGIAPCEAAGAIAAGSYVVCDTQGRAVQAAYASGELGDENDDNALRFTSRAPGLTGNAITVELQASGNNQPLSLSVVISEILINLATDGSGDATSTAEDVLELLEATAAAQAMIRVEHIGASSGAGVMEAGSTDFSGGHGSIGVFGIAQTAASAAGDLVDVLITP